MSDLQKTALPRYYEIENVPTCCAPFAYTNTELNMGSQSLAKRRWRLIVRYVRRKDGQVSVGGLARRFNLAPSNISRGLKRRNILLNPAAFPWQTGDGDAAEERVNKCGRALALYFLGLTIGQIARLLPIKPRTLLNYLRILNLREGAWESLAKELEKAYGLGYQVEAISSYLPPTAPCFAGDLARFFRRFFPLQPPTRIFVRKLRQILHAKIYQHGRSIHITGRNGGLVTVRLVDLPGHQVG